MVDIVAPSGESVSAGMLPNSTYFDALPTDVLSVILGCLRDRKRTVNSQKEELDEKAEEGAINVIPTKSAMRISDEACCPSLVFSEQSPFRAVTSTYFKEVQLYRGYGQLGTWASSRCVDIGPEYFEGIALQTGVAEKILDKCGASVKTVTFSGGLKLVEGQRNGDESIVHQLISLVIEYCRNVEVLIFDFSWSPTLKWNAESVLCREFATQLHSLEYQKIAVDENEQEIPDFVYATMRRFCWDSANSAKLISMLHSSGSTLEYLSVCITDVEGCTEVLDTIQNNCRLLSTILFDEFWKVIEEVGEDRYTSLLCSYGSQLLSAFGDWLSYENLKLISEACSNLEFEGYSVLFGDDNEWKRVGVIGSSLSQLFVFGDTILGDAYLDAVARCINLRELRIFRDDNGEEQEIIDEVIANILSARLVTLEHLSLYNFNPSMRNISLIASSTSNLRYLGLDLKYSIEIGNVFEPIVHSNRYLNCIVITECNASDGERDGDSSLLILSQLLNTFSKCSMITFDLLDPDAPYDFEDSVPKICGCVPCRGLSLSISIGENYTYHQ